MDFAADAQTADGSNGFAATRVTKQVTITSAKAASTSTFHRPSSSSSPQTSTTSPKAPPTASSNTPTTPPTTTNPTYCSKPDPSIMTNSNSNTSKQEYFISPPTIPNQTPIDQFPCPPTRSIVPNDFDPAISPPIKAARTTIFRTRPRKSGAPPPPFLPRPAQGKFPPPTHQPNCDSSHHITDPQIQPWRPTPMIPFFPAATLSRTRTREGGGRVLAPSRSVLFCTVGVTGSVLKKILVECEGGREGGDGGRVQEKVLSWEWNGMEWNGMEWNGME